MDQPVEHFLAEFAGLEFVQVIQHEQGGGNRSCEELLIRLLLLDARLNSVKERDGGGKEARSPSCIHGVGNGGEQMRFAGAPRPMQEQRASGMESELLGLGKGFRMTFKLEGG